MTLIESASDSSALSPPLLCAGGDSAKALQRLSPRERQVLWALSRGFSNKVIAWRLGIKEATIKAHVSSIMRTFGCANRTQAALIALALREGLPLDRI